MTGDRPPISGRFELCRTAQEGSSGANIVTMGIAMKLGTQTSSLTNQDHPSPEVGMGATILCWADRHAATITAVHVYPHTTMLEVQEDHAKRTDTNGISRSQTYDYTPNPDGRKYTFRRAANGLWQEIWFNDKTKRWIKTGGPGLRIGERNHYHDFSKVLWYDWRPCKNEER